jgi:uncharacterized membrane protein YhaH (DUF805 family)
MSSPLTSPLLDDDDPSAPWRIFLDPRGRITRRTFWLYGVLALGGLSLLGRVLLDIARVQAADSEVIVNLLLAWPAIAISAKRWHDRDKSGAWVLLALVPLIGWIWMLVDNGFRRGTAGSNRFGPDPLAAVSSGP